MSLFNLVSKYVPTGDQPQAIADVVKSLTTEEEKYRTIL
jgi:excinuclease UvrABC helicase subunit UvrB